METVIYTPSEILESKAVATCQSFQQKISDSSKPWANRQTYKNVRPNHLDFKAIYDLSGY